MRAHGHARLGGEFDGAAHDRRVSGVHAARHVDAGNQWDDLIVKPERVSPEAFPRSELRSMLGMFKHFHSIYMSVGGCGMPQPPTASVRVVLPRTSLGRVGAFCPLALQVNVLGVRDQHVAGGVRDGERRLAVHDDGLRVTPHAQNTGTSPGLMSTGSPKSGLAMSLMPMTEGSPICTGAPCTFGMAPEICTAFTTWS